MEEHRAVVHPGLVRGRAAAGRDDDEAGRGRGRERRRTIAAGDDRAAARSEGGRRANPPGEGGGRAERDRRRHRACRRNAGRRGATRRARGGGVGRAAYLRTSPEACRSAISVRAWSAFSRFATARERSRGLPSSRENAPRDLARFGRILRKRVAEGCRRTRTSGINLGSNEPSIGVDRDIFTRGRRQKICGALSYGHTPFRDPAAIRSRRATPPAHAALPHVPRARAPAALAFSSFALVSASGDDHAWEYEAVFDIQEASETYSLNMANAADETMKFASPRRTTPPRTACTRWRTRATRTRRARR